MKTILTVGVYDLLHRGHVNLFRNAKNLSGGGKLIVAVQDSAVVNKFKPQAKLIGSTEDRMFMVSAIRFVDEVIVYSAVNELVKEIDFDILAVGPDQNHEAFQMAFNWCKDHRKEVVVIPRTKGVSSSQLKDEIKDTKR